VKAANDIAPYPHATVLDKGEFMNAILFKPYGERIYKKWSIYFALAQ